MKAQLSQVSDPRERASLQQAKVVLTSAARGLPRLRQQFSLQLRILLALVAVLLFSASVNIVNLLLARSRAQAHEAAIRIALGSSRARLVANRMTETLLLVAFGGALSLPLAIAGSKIILHWLVIGGDLQMEITPDWSMLAFTASITLIAGVAVAILPALRAADVMPADTLGARTQMNAGQTRRAARWSLLLVSTQIAFSIASLVVAGLLTHTLLNCARLGIGMDREHVLSVGIDPSAAGYHSAAQLNALYGALTAAIDKMPGVVSSSVGGCGLMNNGCAKIPLTIRGTRRNSRYR